MRRRHVLFGGTALAAAALVGCSGGPLYDASNAERDFPPIGSFAEVEGLRLHYWEQGDGPPVVLVHGASGNIRDWTFSIAPELAKSFRVIAIDRPGFGYSQRPSSLGWDPAVQARLMQGLTRQIGAERPVVVGHSWGGALAMSWALQFPEETAGVIPVSGVTMPYGGLSRVFRALGLDGILIEAYSNYVRRTAAEGGIDNFVSRAFRPQQPPEGYLAYVGPGLSLREATVVANQLDIQNLNVALRRMEPVYGTLTMPVEILHGTEDFISANRHAVPLSQKIPQARLTLLSGVGHMAHHIRTDALKAAIERVVA
ncbi:MAG: alpha/beta hydrolase [Pseudomonadota bacterium]